MRYRMKNALYWLRFQEKKWEEDCQLRQLVRQLYKMKCYNNAQWGGENEQSSFSST